MVIGITGSIATGKSTVSNYIIQKGYELVDSDKLAYDCLTVDQDSISKVISLFDCADDHGKIDRKKLANIVFTNQQAKKDLENIVHPYVVNKIKEAIQNKKGKHIFLDIPLLYEASLEYLCDRIVVVYVNEKDQLTRLIQRNNYTLEEAKSRINNQISVEKKKELANYIISNEGSLDDLYNQIENFLNCLEKGEVQWK